MEEDKGCGGAGGGGELVRASSSFVSVGGRQRFTVELRPGETTIVSWKKLVKDASNIDGPASVPEPPSNAHPALESRLAPGQPAENELKDAPPSRFSAVIEKIERLYMGKHSSDEEDLNDIPEDDEYDTEDSFIDDAELDEYFQVDNSAIKHDGFFVNRGKLERINEPTSLPSQQPKKRRRKDLAKSHGEGDDVHMPSKHVKVRKKAVGKSVPLVGKGIATPSHIVALPSPSLHRENMKFQSQINSSAICSKKRSAEIKTSMDVCPPSKVPNDDALSLAGENDIGKQKTGTAPSKYQGNKLKDGGEISDPDPSVQRSLESSSFAQCKSQSANFLNNVNELDQSVQQREKDGIRERPDLNVLEGKYSMQMKAMQKKEGSSVRPKSTMLEKAIRELEKTVAESRPPTMEFQDADISSQAVKRRLPREVKQKLAKVARLAQASHGKISIELVNRLMSILGHLVQLRTLKRNLKDMVNMGLSAKKEKDNRFQLMKKDIAQLIQLRVHYMKSKAVEQHTGASDELQEISNEEKEFIKRKYSMDDALEDKICDLYDLYVEGLDEDAGPQVRKLYAELAELWPVGFMDNHGIKRAICRAKDRKRALYSRHKDQERIKRKKLIPKTEETVQIETSTVAHQQHAQEKLLTDSNNNHGLTSLGKQMLNTTEATATVGMPCNTMVNDPTLDRPKHEKAKGSSSNHNDAKTMDALLKKKLKRKPELEWGETQFCPLKVVASSHGEERHKSRKQVVAAAALLKPSLPVAASAAPLPPNFEQPSRHDVSSIRTSAP